MPAELPSDQVIQEHYGVTGPFERMHLAVEGQNNFLAAFRSPSGTFVWKRGGMLGAAQVREFRLLEWLSCQRSSFRVPAPIRTRSGAWGWEDAGMNVLLPFLPGGTLPESADAWRSFGGAVRELHEALAAYPVLQAPWPQDWADLHALHPSARDPVRLSVERADLWGGTETAERWRTAYEETLRLVSQGYADLPRQVLHGDCNSANVLHDGQRVTAVLDFEFACVGPRVLDVATALSEVLIRKDSAWDLARAFQEGYGPLTREERAALPAAMLVRQAAVGVFTLGQACANGAALHLHARLRALLTVRSWLAENALKLVGG